jgi:hypothetical protein
MNKCQGTGRLGVLQSTCVAACVVLVLFALVRAISVQPDTKAASALRSGIRALQVGDYRQGLTDIDRAINLEPRSLYALSAKACVLWNLGYRDNATALLQAALADGLQWNHPLYLPCFAADAEVHGIEFAQTAPLYTLYAAPTTQNARRLDALVQRYVAHGPAPLAMLSLACLNDAEGLQLVAAIDLGLALNDSRMGRQRGLLASCLQQQFAHRYIVTGDSAGIESYAPKDLSTELFNPAYSPIPARDPGSRP